MFPTPTPIPFTAPVVDLPIDGQQIGHTMASGVIQGWNLFNTQGISDVLFIVLLVLIIVFGIVSIRRHLEAL